MKNYNSKKYNSERMEIKMARILAELGIVSTKGLSKIGITRKSHEETKKHRKIAAKSVRINRKNMRVRR